MPLTTELCSRPVAADARPLASRTLTRCLHFTTGCTTGFTTAFVQPIVQAVVPVVQPVVQSAV